MITKDNKDAYQSLFNEINTYFKYSGDDAINDIGDYFMELDNIKTAVENKLADPSWLIIPANEDMFEIDANTRNIKVPTEFSRNGIAVQGDHMAEVLFFSIDRYFDITDLYNKDIYIQFELPDGEQYLAAAIHKTINFQFQKNKVVFGWIITEEMTEKAGNIKFAVRFYDRTTDEYGNKKLSYSFSTLTATVKVNASLDFDIDSDEEISTMIIDAERDYYKLLRSSTDDNIAVPAATPIFIDMTPDTGEEYFYDTSSTFSGRAKFDSNDLENKSMGTISYAFRYIDKNKNEMAPTNETVLVYDLMDLDSETLNEYEAYYIKETKEMQEYYVPYSYKEWTDNVESRPEEIYKMRATLQPDKAGSYFLRATNQAGRGNFATVDSDKWQIAFAKEALIDYTSGLVAGETYEHRQITAGGSVELKPAITSPDAGELTYQWFKDNSRIDSGNTSSYTANTEGRYTVEVINKKNNDTTKVVSEEMRVSYPPEIPVIDAQLVNGEIRNDISQLYDATSLSVTIKPLGSYTDNVSYQWYIVDRDNPEGKALEGETSNIYNVKQTGVSFFVKVINNYNTFTAETVSGKFTVMSN